MNGYVVSVSNALIMPCIVLSAADEADREWSMQTVKLVWEYD